MIHVTAGGVSILVDPQAASIEYWGAELALGDDETYRDARRRARPHTSLDDPPTIGLVAQESLGYTGRPTLLGSRDGLGWSPRFTTRLIGTDDRSVTIGHHDDRIQLEIRSTIALSDEGLLTLRHELTNLAATEYTLHQLGSTVPVPWRADRSMDLAGRWSLERQPQTRILTTGIYSREIRHGRPGFESPLVLSVGTAEFAERTGEVWAIHLGWSGNSSWWTERTADGHQFLSAAELMGPGGLQMSPGETYSTPILYASWSDQGLDGIARRFHRHVRSRPEHPRRPRPVTFNSWEAVYFQQDLPTLIGLVDLAADTGVERFVLDDGWFQGRRDDTAGLGDWWVDRAVWPDGLEPLARRIKQRGMEFGLWFEPEMVNPESALYRDHPDWVLQVEDHGAPLLWRNQLVLDLGREDVLKYLFTRIDLLIDQLGIDYVKWDHNRDLLDAGGRDQRHGVHAATLGVYRLIDAIKSRHPRIEIESCASGGGRVDLGILARTDRVWASDTNDALDRQVIQRWTHLLLPPELVGSHVGPPTAHITGRTHNLAFRAAIAIFGSFGIEWDLSSIEAADMERLSQAVRFYQRFRALIHSGDLVHADLGDPSAALEGVVSADGREALFRYAQLSSPQLAVPTATRFPGLDPGVIYEVRRVEHVGGEYLPGRPSAAWWEQGALRLPGTFLTLAGIALPALRPEQAIFIHLSALDPIGTQ